MSLKTQMVYGDSFFLSPFSNVFILHMLYTDYTRIVVTLSHLKDICIYLHIYLYLEREIFLQMECVRKKFKTTELLFHLTKQDIAKPKMKQCWHRS